ncbi:MAG: endonuclease/exonuclease/phosphatase family protein [Saprospiraceae bacterium]|nr:endonuclease/exonuclease/phosphatase family protein [Saprospiraceae bacterium]
MRLLLLVCFIFFVFVSLHAQQQAKVGCIGFYNLENLFDTEDDPLIDDSEYLPTGSKLWTTEMYESKLNRMAEVIVQVGTEVTPDGLALLGVAEVENRKVLEDLVKNPIIAPRNYDIVHYDSPDARGIDVGLLYQKKYFTVTNSKPLPVILFNADSTRRYTRDILLVSGLFDGDTLHVLVNHWPSRSGGEEASRPYREKASSVAKSAVDSLMNSNMNAKIIIMGDLNDDPVSSSIRKVLECKRDVAKIKQGDLYNPMEDLYKRGIGTLAYQDAWNLFDQLIISSGLVQPVGGYQFYKTQIFNKPFMVQKEGQFKGYPLRTHAGSNYLGGYSDHFPVYLFLVKRL